MWLTSDYLYLVTFEIFKYFVAIWHKDSRKPFHGPRSHDNFPEENNGEKVLLAQVWTGDIGPRD